MEFVDKWSDQCHNTCNAVVIDAKSILGVLSMDLTRVLTVRCNGEDERFNNFLNKYAVA